MAKKVFVSAGHGGSDPGACANGFKEKDLNLVIALSCRDELVRHGVEILMNRTTDVSTTSTQDITACNRFDPDLAVDIHNNAGGGNGAEVYHHYKGGVGKTLANNILSEMVAIGQNSRGAKTKKNSSGRDYYYFIREIAAPAVIVECAFVDNKTDIEIIDSAEKQKKMGVAIAKGILKTLGIAYKEVVAEPDICLPTLKKGAKGETVRALQILLIGNNCSCGSYGADGDFGSGTQGGVKEYQQKNSLPATGIVDTDTWNKLLGLK